jgi:hypothetical protein
VAGLERIPEMNWMNECKLNLHHHRCQSQKHNKGTIRPKLPNSGLLRSRATQTHILRSSHFDNCHHRSSQICSVLYPSCQQGLHEYVKRIHTNRIERNIKRKETVAKLLFLFGTTKLYMYRRCVGVLIQTTDLQLQKSSD